MKIRFLAIILTALLLSSCYEDHLVDTVGFSDVYFKTEVLQRSALAGEGLDIKVGVNLGGLRVNDNNVKVEYVVDEALLSGTAYTALPSGYYDLKTEGANKNQIIIPQGQFMGYVTVVFDSLKLAQDPLMADYHYAIPFKITEASDSILAGKESMIVPIRLMNTYEGYYYALGSVMNSDTLVEQYGAVGNLPRTPIRQLSSYMMDTVIVDGVANHGGDKYSMRLKVHSDHSVDIVSVNSSLFSVVKNGDCTWDPKRRTFHLKYKYMNAGNEYVVDESLMFRNRTRDGIDQWRWEGFEGN